ncbi:hypothetical protein N9W01_00195 [bacterium]|jgi:hypothetical protein|nr:hypothetical protein [bacterium]
MSKFLLEQLEEKFEEMESKDTLQEEDIDEANVTGNMDGGAGPPKTPNAFAKSEDEDDLDTDHIEVLGYKKAKKSKMNTESKTMKKLEDRLERIIEATYRDYKKDDSMKAHQKVNKSIKEINRMMYEVEKIVNQNTKLKSEMGVSNEQYWQSTQKRFSKISERMLKVARSLKELSA